MKKEIQKQDSNEEKKFVTKDTMELILGFSEKGLNRIPKPTRKYFDKYEYYRGTYELRQ
jgi:hypothetical protein